MKQLFITTALLLGLTRVLSAAPWPGFIDKSTELQTSTFSFTGTVPEAYDSNENYYDGDFADFDGDGWMDRGLGARYGLLKNKGQAFMTPYAGANLVNYMFRGLMSGWGEDAFQWADVDNDGDLDILQGGNGEPFTCQINAAGRFRLKWNRSGSALNIVNIDIEKDGDVDLVVAHAFCSDALCGHGCPDANCQGGSWPKEFHLWVNDGNGNFTDQVSTRGFPANFGTNLIVGVVAGDVDGDADFDLMMINGIARGITLARNNGSGMFSLSLVPFAVSLAPIRPIGHGFSQAMNLGDIDNDGDLDLVCALARDTAGTSNPRVGHAVFINNGAGAFTDETATRFNASQATNSFLNADNGKLMDIDYDGDFDFLAFDSKTSKHLQIFTNDGAGRFTYSSNYSRFFAGGSTSGGTGADTDVTDINGDGTYDLWIGAAGSDVRILINPHQAPDRLPANMPRNFQLVSTQSNAVSLAWEHPSYADISRWYAVYRSTAAGLAKPDWRLIKRVTISRHQDEGFAAPLTRFTTSAYLNDPDVVLVGSSNLVQFTDRTALPGVTYYYAVSHIGTENTESALTQPVSAKLPSLSGTDITKPILDIISPTSQHWSSLPRIVLQYGDGGSGIDASSLYVAFNVASGRPAGANLADIFFRRDDKAYIAAIPPGFVLPTNTLVTMTAAISDHAGNRTTNSVQFFVNVPLNQPPSATFSASATNGLAPLTVALSASGSDPDGKPFQWEWYFGDGTTGFGQNTTKTYTTGGDHTVTLLVRDTSGAYGMATQTISVSSFLISSVHYLDDTLLLRFPTTTNKTYTVERTASLSSSSWSSVGTLEGSGAIKTYTNNPATPGFYRIRVD